MRLYLAYLTSGAGLTFTCKALAIASVAIERPQRAAISGAGGWSSAGGSAKCRPVA